MEAQVEVTVSHGNGSEGPGWYVWETEYPEEGYVYFNQMRPGIDDLRSICASYVEAN